MKLFLTIAFTLVLSSFASATPKAIPHDSLLNLVQMKANSVLGDVRVVSSTSHTPVSVCGSPEQVFYTLHLQIKRSVRVGAYDFKDSWETVKSYTIAANEVDGKTEEELSSVVLMADDTCAE